MPELGSYGSVGAGEGNLSLYPELFSYSVGWREGDFAREYERLD